MRKFMFAIGIENSYPTIQLPDGTNDLDRNIRDVGKAYKHIIKQWSPVLEKEPVGLWL